LAELLELIIRLVFAVKRPFDGWQFGTDQLPLLAMAGLHSEPAIFH
jgi:hypothetical protein